MSDNEFIHVMKIAGRHYIYDVNTDSVLAVSQSTAEYLESKVKEEFLLDQETMKEINKLKANGYLKSNHPKTIEDPRIDDTEYYLSNRLEQATLQVTQQCNLRCSYCNFTNTEDTLTRSHSSKKMNLETAKKSVDFLAEHSHHNEQVTLSFYGGEPLLQFELIQEVIEYAKMRLEGKALYFSMTTNALLLKPEIFKYLIESNVIITVSLDGPEEIHNKSRKLASDGNGSFSQIYSVLKDLKRQYPEYYKKLLFNCVVDPQNKLVDVTDFYGQVMFDENEILTPIMDPGTGKELFYPDEFIKENTISTLQAYLCALGLVERNRLNIVARNIKDSLKQFENQILDINVLPERIGHGGPCFAGVKSLFISADGKFYACEKVSELDTLCIGDIDKGYNIDAVKEQVNLSSLTKDRCKNCWAILHCNICVKDAHTETIISPELIESKCKDAKDTFEFNLLEHIGLNETASILKRHYK